MNNDVYVEYRIGDKVTIREWDDMAAEFPCHDDYIEMYFYFVGQMACFCGETFEISSIIEHGKAYMLKDTSGRFFPERLDRFTFSPEMFTDWNAVCEFEFSDEDQIKFMDLLTISCTAP